jgi:hypothetical protein
MRDMSESNNSGGGIDIFGATFIVFLVLKLVGTIDWSWWWVTAPLWIPLTLVLAILGVVVAITAAAGKE